MRLDIAESHQWSMETAKIAATCSIFLNNKLVDRVLVADEEAGYVEYHPLGADGKLIPEGDGIKRERLEGEVIIRSPHRAK